MDTNLVTSQIADLVARYEEMKSRATYDDLSDLRGELSEFAVRLQAAADRLIPVGTTYSKEAESQRKKSDHVRVPALISILRALRADIDAGWMTTVEELLHARTFADFLTMANELQTKGYKDAAAVITGSVLEAHLRLLCLRNDIITVAPGDRPKKADAMNADLARARVYNQLQQKHVTAWIAIRNAAAHGEYRAYTGQDVANLLSSVGQFVLSYPA